jgi:hypothetical protein
MNYKQQQYYEDRQNEILARGLNIYNFLVLVKYALSTNLF